MPKFTRNKSEVNIIEEYQLKINQDYEYEWNYKKSIKRISGAVLFNNNFDNIMNTTINKCRRERMKILRIFVGL